MEPVGLWLDCTRRTSCRTTEVTRIITRTFVPHSCSPHVNSEFKSSLGGRPSDFADFKTTRKEIEKYALMVHKYLLV